MNKRWRQLAIQGHPTLPWSELTRRLATKISKDDVFGRAAELAYFFLFSVFPLLLVFTNLLGIISAGPEIQEDLLRYFRGMMPAPAYGLVSSTLDQITRTSGGGKLSVGIVLTLASASSGMVAIIEGLNTAYEVKEARKWFKRRVVALILTITLAVFTIAALGIMLHGSQMGDFIADMLGARSAFQEFWRIAQWPVVAGFVLLAFSIVYRFAPNVQEQKWYWVLPGALAALVLWFAASVGLRLYLTFVGSYSSTYGSVGAVIALMLWLYLFGSAILIGGELNSIIEQAAARAGDPEAKLPGETAPGQRRK